MVKKVATFAVNAVSNVVIQSTSAPANLDTNQLGQFDVIATGGKTPYSYSWNWGDGSSSSVIRNPTHKWAIDGTYGITVRVTDANNHSQSRQLQILITKPPDPPPPGSIGVTIPIVQTDEFEVFLVNVEFKSTFTADREVTAEFWIKHPDGTSNKESTTIFTVPAGSSSIRSFSGLVEHRGSHTLTIYAKDAIGNVYGQASKTVNIDPPVSVVAELGITIPEASNSLGTKIRAIIGVIPDDNITHLKSFLQWLWYNPDSGIFEFQGSLEVITKSFTITPQGVRIEMPSSSSGQYHVIPAQAIGPNKFQVGIEFRRPDGTTGVEFSNVVQITLPITTPLNQGVFRTGLQPP